MIPTTGLQPYVGQVTNVDPVLKQLTLQTLSVGSATLGSSISSGTLVTFGNAATQWTAAPGNRQYQYKILWPTDPSLVPSGVSWTFAKGDGVTDDAPAINNALTMASNAGGGIVMLPAGTFVCKSTLVVAGSNVHLLGAGKDVTIIMQGSQAEPQILPAIILVNGSHHSLRHFTVQGITAGATGLAPGPLSPGFSETLPVDVNLGAGWAILITGAKATEVEDVGIKSTYFGIGGMGFQTVAVRYCKAEDVVGTYFGCFAEGIVGGQATTPPLTPLTIGGNPTLNDVLTVTVTDDQGLAIVVVYTLTAQDQGSTAHTAASLATAINNSGATSFVTAAASGSSIALTAFYGGTQGNLYTVQAAAVGGVSISPAGPTSFVNGAGDASNDFQVDHFACTFSAENQSQTAEAFHCDGGVSTFILRVCSAVQLGYHTRIAKDKNPNAPDSNLIALKDVTSDHSYMGVTFINGRGSVIQNSLITATRSSDSPVHVYNTYAGDLTIENNQIVNNGTGTGITVENAGGVRILNNNIVKQQRGITLNPSASGPASGVKIIGNQIGTVGGIGIDLTGLTSSNWTDWLTILGNNFDGAAKPMKFPTQQVPLGPHSRICDNPGYNPPDPGVYYYTPQPGSSGTAVPNTFYCDAMVAITPGTTTITSVALINPDGDVVPYLSLLPAGATGTTQVFVLVPCGYSITMVYTGPQGVTPTWNWLPM